MIDSVKGVKAVVKWANFERPQARYVFHCARLKIKLWRLELLIQIPYRWKRLPMTPPIDTTKVAQIGEKLVSENPGIFAHQARPNELCAVCAKPMDKGVVQVGSGERMHGECWSTFLAKRMQEIASRAKQS
jgi:hypothetical protein